MNTQIPNSSQHDRMTDMEYKAADLRRMLCSEPPMVYGSLLSNHEPICLFSSSDRPNLMGILQPVTSLCMISRWKEFKNINSLIPEVKPEVAYIITYCKMKLTCFTTDQFGALLKIIIKMMRLVAKGSDYSVGKQKRLKLYSYLTPLVFYSLNCRHLNHNNQITVKIEQTIQKKI